MLFLVMYRLRQEYKDLFNDRTKNCVFSLSLSIMFVFIMDCQTPQSQTP